MSVRLAVILIAAIVGLLVALSTAGGMWFFGLIFFVPALRMVGVTLVDEGVPVRVDEGELERWLSS